MTHKIFRREFAKYSSASIASAIALSRSDNSWAADSADAADKRLVLLGLNALARAPELNYFADGHRGASLVAAHELCVGNGLDEPARARIAALFDRNWASTPLCQPFPEEEADPARVDRIGRTLLEGGEVLREVGHNAIFAMLAIKAFRMLPEAATPQRVDGVCRLVKAMKPWRDVKPDADVDPPSFSDGAAASQYVLRQALAAIDKFKGFGQGFTGHMLTFGHALVELAAMGDVELAEGCRTAFCKYVTVTRRGPDANAKRIADHQPSELRPIEARYWQKRDDHAVDIGHVFKYPYSYYDLLRRAKDPELEQAWEAKAYHLF